MLKTSPEKRPLESISNECKNYFATKGKTDLPSTSRFVSTCFSLF